MDMDPNASHTGGRKNICKNCGRKCVFYNADMTLTRYAFSCGYVEKRKTMTLEMEHGVFHVKGFHADKRVWESFNKVKEARAYFRRFPKR